MIRIQERQETVAGLPGSKLQNSAGPDAFGSGVGRAVGHLGDVLKQKAEDLEDAETLEAMNQFKMGVEKYHNDPDKGLYNTRKGKDAEGLYNDADKWMDNQAFKYAGKLRSARASQNFLKMAGQHWQSQNIQNSRFESGQIKAYRDAEAQATIDLGLNSIAANYTDDDAVAAAQNQMMMALELQTRGLGDEAKKLAYQDMESKVSMTRLGRMIEGDPFAAQEWYKEHKESFAGLDQAKAEVAIDAAIDSQQRELDRQAELARREIEKEQLYSTAESLIARHGTDARSAHEAIWNDPNIPPEMKYQIAGLYDARVADMNRADAQVENDYHTGWMDKIANSKTMEEAQQHIEASGATGHQRRQFDGYAAQLFKPETFQEDILDWNLAYKEITEGKIRTADDFMQRWRGRLSEGSMKSMLKTFYDDDGKGSKSSTYAGEKLTETIEQGAEGAKIKVGSREYYNFLTAVNQEIWAQEEKQKRKLTPVEKYDLIFGLSKRVIKEPGILNRKMPTQQTQEAERSGANYIPGKGYIKESEDGTITVYDPKNTKVPPSEPKHESSQIPDTVPSDDLVAPKAETPLKDASKEEDAKATPPMAISTTPRTRRMPDGRDVDGMKTGRRATRMSGQNGMPSEATIKGMVQGAKVVSSGYDSPRDGGKRIHNAIDVSAPEGSEIRAIDFGSPLTVVRRSTGPKTGNAVTLTGTTAGKQHMEVTIMHLKNHDGPPTGTTVQPGDLLGYVGNTGITSTGPHMHIQIEVDGKRVNPEKYLASITQPQRKA